MKGKTTLVGVLVFFCLFLGVLPAKVLALETCASKGINIVSSNLSGPFDYGGPVQLNVSLSSSGSPGIVAGGSYFLVAKQGSVTRRSSSETADPNRQISWQNMSALSEAGEKSVILQSNAFDTNGLGADGCLVGKYSVTVGGIDCAYLRISKNWTAAPSNNRECYASATSCVESGYFGHNLIVSARLTKPDGSLFTESVFFTLHGPNNAGNDEAVAFGTASQEYRHEGWSPNAQGTYTVTVKLNGQGTTNPPICRGTFLQTNNCQNCITTPNDIAEQIADPFALEHHAYKICDQVSTSLMTPEGANAKDRCIQCIGGDELGRAGIWTAVGCIPRDPDKIVNSLLRLGLGMGGGFALIIILASGFVLSVSQGEPKRIEDAKQWLTSALVGMLFIIFSVTLLHFIGYSIFKIPGFGG